MHSSAEQNVEMELHERLAHARELAGYDTPTEAADALGVNRPTYYGHENGSRGFRAPTARKYADFFRVSFDWLLNGRGEPRPQTLEFRIVTLTRDEQRKVREYIDFLESMRANPRGKAS